MYKLTLTANERRAIDWVDNRYAHGTQLCDLLFECKFNSCILKSELESISDDEKYESWYAERFDIEFFIPEHIAWQIMDIGEQCEPEFAWECFSDELKKKMNTFCERIV